MWTSEKPDLTWNEEYLCEWSWSKQSCIWTHTIIKFSPFTTTQSSRWMANRNCTMSSSLGKFFTNSRLGLTLRNPCFTNSRLVSAKDKSNWNVWNVALAFIWSKFDRISPILKAFRDSFFILTKDDIIIWSYVAQMVQRYHWIENVLVQVSNARSSCFFFFFSLLSSLFLWGACHIAILSRYLRQNIAIWKISRYKRPACDLLNRDARFQKISR